MRNIQKSLKQNKMATVSNKNIHLPVFEICVFRELALLILIERVGSR